MSKRQKELQETLDQLIDICSSRGLGSQHLRAHVHEVCTFGIHVDNPEYTRGWRRADEISGAGLTAQLSFLREAWGLTKIRRVLSETGGVLDAIVRHTSSTPEELATDIGRGNINADGDVV